MQRSIPLAGLLLALYLPSLAAAQTQCTAGSNDPVSVAVNGYLSQANVTVTVDGVTLPFEAVRPIYIGSTVFVEMKALYNALGMNISLFEPAPTSRVTGVKGDLRVVVCLGSRSAQKTIFNINAGNISMTTSAFLAQEYSKVMVPVNFAVDALGARVSINNTTRTVTINSGRTYLFDWNGSSGTYVQYTDLRYLGPEGGTYSCPTGTTFDFMTKYCMETTGSPTYVRGPFPALYRQRCQALGFLDCATDRWRRDQLLEVIDTAGLTTMTTTEVLTLMKSNPEVFGVPYENNDIVSEGLYSPNGTTQASYQRSEDPMPPFVMSARRQTDSMVRQLYLLLPSTVRTTYAFIHPDRLAQTPDAYIPYLQKKRRAYVVGTFMGLSDIHLSSAKLTAVRMRHERELFKLKTTLALLNSMGIQVEGVLYSLGDTIQTGVPLIDQVKAELQTRYNRILTAAGYGTLARTLSFGGDELMAAAFAKALNVDYSVFIRISNPNAQHRYDGLRTTQVLVNQKLPEVGLTSTTTRTSAAFEVHILTREPNIGTKIASGTTRCDSTSTSPKQYTVDDWLYQGMSTGFGFVCPVDRTAQETHDANFMSVLNGYSLADRQRTFIVDARANNGSWNSTAAPRSCDWLGYSGWGTGANNIGMSLAIAKILYHSNNRGGSTLARRRYLEAVAHDVFANGYQDAQRGQFRTDLSNLYGITFNHHPGYRDPNQVYTVFNHLTQFASERMAAHFTGTTCIPTGVAQPFKFTAQFWRTFESEVHMWPFATGESLVPGMHRTGTVPGTTQPMWQVLDPNGRNASSVTRVNMSYLLAE